MTQETVAPQDMAQNTLLVRIRPWNPRAGHTLRRYTIRKIKFEEHRGWYRVPKLLADYLSTIKQRPSNPHSPQSFDVATDDEAQQIQDREEMAIEKRRAEQARDVTVAIDKSALSTADLPQLSGREPDPAPPASPAPPQRHDQPVLTDPEPPAERRTRPVVTRRVREE